MLQPYRGCSALSAGDLSELTPQFVHANMDRKKAEAALKQHGLATGVFLLRVKRPSGQSQSTAPHPLPPVLQNSWRTFMFACVSAPDTEPSIARRRPCGGIEMECADRYFGFGLLLQAS